MPFTFSHPAAILPINHFFKRRLSTTGLVAGSLVPDFEYFVRTYHESSYSHTWAGLFYLDLPAGILLCFLYHNLIREPFYTNAPVFLKRRMAPFQSLRWNPWFVEKWQTVIFCVLLGALTHLLWDKFTHHTVPMVQSASGFSHFVTKGDWLMTYFFFWDVSSLIGIFLLFYAIWTLPSDKRIQAAKSRQRYWLCLGGSTLAFFMLQLSLIDIKSMDNLAIAIVDAFLLSIVFTSILFSFWIGNGRLFLAEKK